jgi:membrane protein insertase Oxa1/YidC/SpoIIIJ
MLFSFSWNKNEKKNSSFFSRSKSPFPLFFFHTQNNGLHFRRVFPKKTKKKRGENNMPGYLSWFGLKQILWVCSKVMNFIYHNIAHNVGLSIILYALFAYLLLSPFSIKKILDGRKNRKIDKKIEELKQKYLSLPEEERAKEEVLAKYKEEEDGIKKGRSSKKVGCLMIFLRLFVVLASTPVVRFFEHFVTDVTPESYMFLGFDLSSSGPGYSFNINLLIPLFTVIVLVVPGYISTWRNLKERKEAKAKKTKEELEEEERMLKEMGIKEGKIPWAWILQIFFTWLYFNSFIKVSLSISFFWGVYYLIGFGIRGLFNYVSAKTTK